MSKTVPQPIVTPSEKDFQLPQPYRSPGAAESNGEGIQFGNAPPYPEAYSGNMDGIQIQDAPASPIASFTSAAPKPITNTDVATSADAQVDRFSQSANANQSQNIAAPISRSQFYNSPMQSTAADKPSNYLSPEARQMVGYGNSALGGLAAGGQVAPTADAGDAALQVLGAGVSGAAAGLATGNPIGAAIGGVAGLVAGGINAWVGTGAARKQQRAQDKIRRDIIARDEARYQQSRRDQERYFNIERGDNLEKERYNRRQTALQSQWAAQEKARNALNETIQQDQAFKHMLVGELR